ncbi:MAG: EAL domain-containing protein [Burkholderiaceae bacterium]|nr:EAL domain-containing protein [Burkholderiaceae bacterium]
MASRSRLKLPSRRRLAGLTDRVLARFSLFTAVIVLAIACVAAAYVVAHSREATFLPDSVGSLLPDPDNRFGLEEASRRFSTSDAIRLEKGGSLRFRTVWIRIELSGKGPLADRRLSLQSLRAETAKFWALAPAGDVVASDLPWSALRNGVAIELPQDHGDEITVIGRIEPIAINRVQISLRSQSEITSRDFLFERTGGLLVGSLLMVSFFSLVVAVFIRDRTFFLYSAWLVTSLRIAAYNGDWDPYWLDIPLSGEPLQLFLRLTYIAHSLISLALFEALFGKELQSAKLGKPIKFLQLATVAMFVPAIFLEANHSIKLLWALSGGTILAVFFVLSMLSIRAPSRALAWYFGSWVITLTGSIAQIAFSMGFWREILNIANSQITSVGSALMLGVTLAQRMNAERQARISAQHSAVSALQRFRENYNAMPVGIFSMKQDGTLIEHNPTFADMFPSNGRRNSKIGLNWVDLMGSDALKAVEELAASDRMMDTELAVQRTDGKRRWFHVRAVRKADRYEGWIEEITARKEAEGQLKFLVDHDSLTGLLNRRGFEIHLQTAIGSAGNRQICLAYVDLDRFKLVNDLFGHAAGDQILRQMATRMREVIRPPNVAARVGGDEFVVIIDGTSLDSAKALCEKLRIDLSDRAYQYQDKAFNVTASIGLIRVLDNMRPADALTASDRACSEAKASGGSTVVSYDSSSSELLNYLDEIKLVAGMKERLPVENFFTQLQPIVSLRNPASSLCYEVLIRMRDTNGQVLPPGRFIPAAERNGLMTQIDRWVLRSTLEWLDSQPEHRSNVDFCTLNLSGASLNDEKFLQDTIALIRAHPESTRKVCFEITESVALYDLNTTRRFVDRVKSFGAMVALDDFGAGYTSFSYLKELPGDLVKIDGNFIRDVNLNRANFAITRAVVDLAHELGMGCVAEWAENAGIVRSLIELQVDYAQGYGVCRPLDRERLLAVPNAATLIRDQETADLILGSAIASRDASHRITLPI